MGFGLCLVLPGQPDFSGIPDRACRQGDARMLVTVYESGFRV